MNLSDFKKVTKVYDKPSSEQTRQTLHQETQGFDYTVLTPQLRIFVQGKTYQLQTLMRRNAQDIVDIGQNLIEVKEHLGHGNFRAWLKAEFDWSVRTAARFMQVATQFKCVNLAHLNIAVSALYFLAQTSTPQEARKQVLELAKEGENINYKKAKTIVNNHRRTQSNTPKPATVNICAESIELDNKLEQKDIEKIDSAPREDSEVPAQLQLEPSNYIRVLKIQRQNPELATNIAQTFELNFLGVRVDLEGNPKALIALFEQMKNNSVFPKKVLQKHFNSKAIELVQVLKSQVNLVMQITCLADCAKHETLNLAIIEERKRIGMEINKYLKELEEMLFIKNNFSFVEVEEIATVNDSSAQENLLLYMTKEESPGVLNEEHNKAKKPPSEFYHLTSRERDVLRMIVDGKSNKEIADALFLAEGTVRNYVSRILNCLNVKDRTQAALIANTYLYWLENSYP